MIQIQLIGNNDFIRAEHFFKNLKFNLGKVFYLYSFFINVFILFRNIINTLYHNETEERKEALNADPSYSNIMNKFEALGNIGNHFSSRNDNNNQNSLSWTSFCILFAAAIGLAVVSVIRSKIIIKI